MKNALLFVLVTILISGCSAARRWAEPVETVKTPNPETALISFVRGNKRESVSIWDSTNLLGIMVPRRILQAELEPGKHMFIAYSGRRMDPLQADLKAGEHYIFVISQYRHYGAKIVPVGSRFQDKRVESWFENYPAMKTMEMGRSKYEYKVRFKIEKYLNDYYKGREKNFAIPYDGSENL